MESRNEAERAILLECFGTTVRRLRSARNLSQEEFADRCGLDRTYIGGIERGERNVGLLNLYRVAGALEMKPSSLFEAVEAGAQ